MNIIYKSRGKGKTTELIKMSAEKNLYILVADKNRQREVFNLARDLNLNILFPITVEDYFRSDKLRGCFINTILIDDADYVLQQIFNTVVIDTITITDKENKWKKKLYEELKAEIRYNGLYNEQIEEIIDRHIKELDNGN